MKILIIQTAFIGDVILATALLEKLHATHPDAQLDFLLRKGNEGLLAAHPFVKNIWIWDKAQKWASWWQSLRTVRAQRYDVVINLQRFGAMGLLTAMSGGKQTVGFDKNPFSRLFSKRISHQIGTADAPTHEVERNQQLIAHLTDTQALRPRLYPTEAMFAQLPTEPYVCLAPASVWATKQLPIPKWVELCQKIPVDTTVYLLGAKSDAELCAHIAQQSGRVNVQNVAGKFNFLQSAALMSRAQMNYVNDSDPLHIASAMNAPVTAFFCSTVPYFGFTPLSDVSIIRQVVTPLECRPCGLHGYKACPKGHFKCGEIEITV